MTLYFCADCVKNWKDGKIMECNLCQTHLDAGWSIQLLDNVYGNKKDALGFLGLQIEVVPPLADRTPVQSLAYQNIRLVKLELLKHILTTPFHLLENHIKTLLKDEEAQLVKCQQQHNKGQYTDFIKNEFRVLNLFNIVTTYQTKDMCWRAVDPLIQHIMKNARELLNISY
jgi:hypothetical protein